MKKLLAALAVLLVAGVALRLPLQAQDDMDKKPTKETKETKETKKEGGEEKADKSKAALGCVGGLCASTSYFSFVLIGVTADSFAKGTYEAKTAKDIAAEVEGIVKKNREQLKDLKKAGGLDEADQKSLGEFVRVLDEVADYAHKLQEYCDDKSDENGTAFQEARKKAWTHIKKALGLKD